MTDTFSSWLRRAIPKTPKPGPACPRCYRKLAMTDRGWVCIRHGIQDVGEEKGGCTLRPGADSPPTSPRKGQV